MNMDCFLRRNDSDVARVVELVDTLDSKSGAAMCVGSSPIPGKFKTNSRLRVPYQRYGCIPSLVN